MLTAAVKLFLHKIGTEYVKLFTAPKPYNTFSMSKLYARNHNAYTLYYQRWVSFESLQWGGLMLHQASAYM